MDQRHRARRSPNAILELMTREHGRHLGLVRGAGCALAPRAAAGQPRQRHLAGAARRASRQLRGGRARSRVGARFLDAAHALYGVTHLAALCRLLPERDPHPQIHATLDDVLGALVDARLAGPRMVVRFELQLLAELGFGLDLATCAATGGDRTCLCLAQERARGLARSRPSVAGQAPAPSGLSAEMRKRSRTSAADLADGFA